MSRIRTIKPEFWSHPRTAKASREARLLFLALLNEADDEGLMRYSAKRLAGVVFPYDDDVTEVTVDGWVNDLSTSGLIQRYDVDGASYLLIPGFTEHQRVSKPRPTTLPRPFRDSSATPPRPVAVGMEWNGMEEEWNGMDLAPAPADAEPEPSPPRPADPLWDALLAVCGISGPIAPSARGAYNRARKDLAACDATPETIRQRAAQYRKRWPTVSLTPTALAKHWAECSSSVAASESVYVPPRLERCETCGRLSMDCAC